MLGRGPLVRTFRLFTISTASSSIPEAAESTSSRLGEEDSQETNDFEMTNEAT